MEISRFMLGLVVLSGLLGLGRSQLKYDNHIAMLNQLPTIARTQDLMAKILMSNLEHVDKHNFLSVLGKNFEIQKIHPHNESNSDLKYKSEMALQSSAAAAADMARNTFVGNDIGPECMADMLAYIQHIKLNLSAGAEWALRMADATGKPGAGLLSGSFTFIGDFDECRAVTAKYKSVFPVAKERQFLGQYCVGQYSINLHPIPKDGFNHKWAVCIPDSCSEKDALQISNLALKRYKITQLAFETMTCNIRHFPWTPRAIGMFTLVGVIVFLVVIGTVLDIMLVQVPKWRQSKDKSEDSDKEMNRDWTARPIIRPIEDEMFRVNSDTESLSVNRNPAPTKVEGQPDRQSLAVRIFMAFSIYTNAEKLLNFKQPPGTLTCLNGLRVISINWVILGHTCLFMFTAANNVGAFAQKALKRYSFQVVINATFSVDTFFVMSGLLLTYATLNQMKKTRGKVNWLKFYVHRYLRLTPVYMITFGIYLACIPYLVDGPLLPQRDGFEQDPNCQHNWWGNLLYVQNLVKFKPHYCGSWAWYLAVDMQFYAVSPLLLIPLYHRPRLGYLVAVLFFLMTTVTPIVLVVTRHYPAGRAHLVGNPKKLGDENYDIYISPYCRMGSYLVGVMTGFVMHRVKDQTVRMHRAVVVAGWAASIVVGVLIVYGLKDYYTGPGMTIQLAAFYTAFARIAWGLAVAWVIFTCHHGYGGLINSFLSWTIWTPLARLTYVVYLIHMILLFVLGSTSRAAISMDDWSIVHLYLVAMMASYSLAVVISLFFEAPGLALERVLLPKKRQ
ncbi:nose resistant to fluoxetine protein 6-like [Elysia marginata]|uniref:Nose resistant to fluoxetine protein 6-like n=1 Tax=Elysia marginata TaxID=1093978 RepID=A0AAV4HMQ7_9GAST|nr:nose resistant to fluoxetine protein 6-like [Elysia marginata]